MAAGLESEKQDEQKSARPRDEEYIVQEKERVVWH